MSIFATSTSAFFERSAQSLTALRSQAEDLQNQISTNSKVTKSSDNPLAASQLRALARAVDDLLLHLVGVAHLPVMGERVEAEDTVVVAVEGEPHPVALLMGGVLVLEELVIDAGARALHSQHAVGAPLDLPR